MKCRGKSIIKLLADICTCSCAETSKWVVDGKVKINNKIITDINYIIDDKDFARGTLGIVLENVCNRYKRRTICICK